MTFTLKLGIRVNTRYYTMLEQAIQHSRSIASGIAIPASEPSAFATTLAVSRFFGNEKTPPLFPLNPYRPTSTYVCSSTSVLIH